jgi:hypothetical protein
VRYGRLLKGHITKRTVIGSVRHLPSIQKTRTSTNADFAVLFHTFRVNTIVGTADDESGIISK